ncbi:MAG: hypothetical protein HY850_07675 [Betaproteobacteria bacterium]|nr:hypothetical protein [Betaproteobacteria bacterium]
MRFNLIFVGLLALLSATAQAGRTNPNGVVDVVTQSIEISGVQYKPGDTVTLTSPNVSFRVTAAGTTLTTNTIPAASTAWYASLCTDTASCVLDGSGQFVVPQSEHYISNMASTTVASGTYKVFYSDTAKSFFSFPAHPQQINTQSLGLNIVIATPAVYGIKTGGNAVASAGLAANGGVYFETPSGWVQWKGQGALPAFVSGPLTASHALDIGSYDLAGLTGATLYVGYGKGSGTAADADLLTC